MKRDLIFHHGLKITVIWICIISLLSTSKSFAQVQNSKSEISNQKLELRSPNSKSPILAPQSLPQTTQDIRTASKIQWYTMFENIPRDWERWYDISFRKELLTEWMIIGGLTVATILTDDITYTPSARFYHSSPEAKKWSDFCANIGDGTTQFAVAGSFGAYGIFFKDQKALRVGSQIVQAVLASGAVIQVLKHVTGRESPFVRTTPTGVWKILPNQVDYHRYVPHFDAYPSGHICTSIATVIVVAENYPDVKWIRPVGYTFTTLVGLGMLANGIHWISDYPLGLFIGYYFGMIAAHPEGLAIASAEDGAKVQILPCITPMGTGLNLNVQF